MQKFGKTERYQIKFVFALKIQPFKNDYNIEAFYIAKITFMASLSNVTCSIKI